ncbi:hypothetical protein DM02DRAFT_146568 [Periconia macrospinosa]|uniref:Tho complex subunit 7 n=1 Tax=Periconia macrospinosa TaxID=97972 RepID=A0A2V1DBX2_9PLEO|nr:hypothetical protein DM02DRAFT_146568 [Periconia macrospinosa]
MAIKNWGQLPQADEDALHNVSRLLAVEVRPFARISSRLTKQENVPAQRPKQLPSPPPDASAADENAAAIATERENAAAKMEGWRRDIMTDLELLDYTVLRFELTTKSNIVERERYAQEKISIKEKQEHVKETIETLRVDLQNAKETLETRKYYDELTEKITSSKMLKTRQEQNLAHAKLDEEIAELQHEVENAKATWNERRQQFFRIDEAAQEMHRMIKDEKEEAERKEGMMKDRDEEGDGETTRGDVSHAGTPRPDGGMTPIHFSQSMEASNTLKVPQDRLAPLSRSQSVAASPGKSDVDEDTKMESGDVAEDDQDGDSSGLEEGEDIEEGEHEEGQSEHGADSDREMDG